MGKKGKGKGNDDDDMFAQADKNDKGYVSLKQMAANEAKEADKGGTTETVQKKSKKKDNKKAKEDDAAFDANNEESKEVVVKGDDASEDEADIEAQKAAHFQGVDAKNTRKKKKIDANLYGGGQELGGAFEEADEDEHNAKDYKNKKTKGGNKKQQAAAEKDAKKAAMQAAKQKKKAKKDDYDSESDDDAAGDNEANNEEEKKNDGDAGVFGDIGKQFGKGSKKGGKGKKDQAAAEEEDKQEEMLEKAIAQEQSNEKAADEFPLFVIYCARCGLPPEYCSFGQKDISACKEWLQGAHPVLFREIYGEPEGGTVDADGEEKKVEGDGGEEGKDGEPMQKAQKQKIAKNSGIINIYKLKRGGKKIQCLMTGWEFYCKDLKALCSKFQKKFSCGASTAQDEQYGACIQVQGDIEERLLDYLEEDKDMQKLEIPIDKLNFESKGNKKGRKKH